MGKIGIKNKPKLEPRESLSSKKKSWKNPIKLAIFSILLMEAIKIIVIQANRSQDVFLVIVVFLLSLTLLGLSFFLNLCMDNFKSPRNRMIREFILFSSHLLFLFIMQKIYLDDKQDNRPLIDINSRGMATFLMLAVMLNIQQMMDMTPISQILIVFYFVAFFLFQTLGDTGDATAANYFDMITPGVYLIILVVFQFLKGREKKPVVLSPASPVEKIPPFLQMVDESIFTCDKSGNFKLINHICIRNVTFKNENDFLTKIGELKLTKEEKLDMNDRFRDLTQILEKDELEEPPSATVPRQKAYQKVALNIGVDPMANLSSLIKSTLVSIASKEFTEPKLLKYDGEIKRDTSSIAPLHIKLYVLPNYEYPVIAVIKNNPYKKDLEVLKNFEQTRAGIMANFYNELSRINELSRTTLRNYDQIQSFGSSKSEEKVETIAPPLLLGYSVINRLLEDNIEFCCLRTTEFKFRYVKCNLKNLIEATLNMFQGYAKIKKVNLIFKQQDTNNEFEVTTDPDRLSQLLIQLIYNSLKFTQHHCITITLIGYSKTFKIMLEDPGSEIPEPELIQINEDLAATQPSYTKLFAKKHRNKEVMIANSLAIGLGRKPLSGLNLKSNRNNGTTIWFFIENQMNSLESTKTGEKSVFNLGHFGSNYKSLRPSIFKMTFEYNSKDSVNSYSELNESVEVGSVSNSSLDRISHRGSQIPPLRSPRGSTLSPFAESPDYKKGSNIIHSIINELPDSMSSRGDYVIIISNDEEETNKIAEITAGEGFISINVSSWDALERELKGKNGKILLVIVDLELASSYEDMKEMNKVLKEFNRTNGVSVPVVGIRGLLSQREVDEETETLFSSEFLTKPLAKGQVVQLLRSSQN